MSVDISITVGNTTLPLSAFGDEFIQTLSPAEQHAVRFCLDWRNGKDIFEIKTSGSTGQPKVIALRREQMIASAHMTAKALGLQKGMTALACLDTNLVGGLMMLVRSMELGMNLVIKEPLANPFINVTSGVRIDFVALVPYQLKTILSSPQANSFNTIQKVIIGGGDVDANLEKSLQAYTTDFYATYGMTETISHVALRRLNGGQRQRTFHAFDGVHLYTDERGCLVIRAGYLGADPIVTNDVVELTSPTEFRWLGRADFVINSGGVKVNPEKVEAAIAALMPQVRYFVHGFPHHKLGEQVCLVVEGNRWSNERIALLLEAMKSELSKFEVPKQVLFVERFVLAGNEKINRKETVRLVTLAG